MAYNIDFTHHPMRIIRKTIPIKGYASAYPDITAKQSYQTTIYLSFLFFKFKLRTYYMVYHIFRTIGIKEAHLGLPSVTKDYGEKVKQHYVYMDEIPKHSLRRITSALTIERD